MPCQDRFALEKSPCAGRALRIVQPKAACPTLAVTPTACKARSTPANGYLSCNAFFPRGFVKPVEVADTEPDLALAVLVMAHGALLIAEGGLARV